MFPTSDTGWLDVFGKLYIWASLGVVLAGGVALIASDGIKRFSDKVTAVLNRELAAARRDAADANERAAKADERAGIANEAAGRANERAGLLEKEAADARHATEELQKANIESQSALEKERMARLELENALKPRMFKQLEVARALSEFRGVKVDIATIQDWEARRTSLLLASTLAMAKWDVGDIVVHSDPESDLLVAGHFAFSGIHIAIGTIDDNQRGGTPAEWRAYLEERRRIERAHAALIRALVEHDIVASDSSGGSVPPDSIRVFVSFKPTGDIPDFLKARTRAVKEKQLKQ